MNEQHLYRATIPPIPEGTPRPLWSVMIPTYNCAKYLRDTLASVLVQDPGPEVMQIEVVDDCSTKDNPAAVVEELGTGRVGFYQQPENVGHTRNFETCLKRARGKLIHLLHGDDCVRNSFYHKMQQAFEKNPEIAAAFCRHIHMDEHGHWQYISPLEQFESGVLNNWLEKIAVQQRIQTPSIVVRRDVYEKMGNFDSRLSWCEDWEMWVRMATEYPIWYEVEPLALYRTHSNSSSGYRTQTGENVQDLRRAINIMKEYLPNQYTDISKLALKSYALYALNDAGQFIAKGNTTAAINQIKEAAICCSSLRVFINILKLSVKLIYMKTINRFSNHTIFIQTNN